jgi:peptide/nickel transport system substrate-binding protein
LATPEAPEQPTPELATPARKGSRTLLAIVAVIVVIAVVGSAAYVLTLPPAVKKYPLELWYNNDGHYGTTEENVATVLKSSIESCGHVAVTLKSDTWAAYKQRLAAGQMPVFLLGWYPDYFDSDNYVSPFMSTSGGKSRGSFYSNASMDALIVNEGIATTDAARAENFTKIQNGLAADVPYVPLFSGVAQAAYVNGVTNVELHPVVFKWFIVGKTGASQLNVSTNDKIITLDPASAYDFMSGEIINQVFDTLLVYEPVTSKLMPGLATQVPSVANGGITNGGKTFTFHLRSGVTFSDGTAFNSSVVKRSIDRAIRLDLPASAANLLYDVGALRADHKGGNNTTAGTILTPDATTVVFNLVQPVSFFNNLMAYSVAAPVPWTYSQTKEQPSTVGSVVGTGPYTLTTHTVNSLVVLKKNPSYFNPGVYASFGIPTIPVIPQVNIKFQITSTALKQDLETKAVDVVFRTLAPADLTDLQNRATALGITVKLGSSPQIRYLVINQNTISDKRVRQAIAYSVNRADINRIVFNNQVSALYSLVPPAMPFSSPVFQPAYGDANCAAANALIAKVGYGLIQPVLWIARDN